ncbi:hypothetical protein U8C37_31965 (plasmid) [Sinorhizobium medicae]|uniref:hypothetical protein n=1 Tax=Sinorhizobium medicae TaxID=110321 RepID=UPI0018659727|nr:hypothetical protein [Sinorhizobium medicae]WQO63731.1 hypothetical protein U8C35_34610 [Sinorhizobium medicae]WQO90232.1 hypothetical protein U8C37_31965 [Sinorhizobium medicae]
MAILVNLGPERAKAWFPPHRMINRLSSGILADRICRILFVRSLKNQPAGMVCLSRAKIRLLPATCLFEVRMVLVTRRDERSVDRLQHTRSTISRQTVKPPRQAAFAEAL